MKIVITGATSGIGAALALYYAKPKVTLGLIGRRKERLKETVNQCEAQGASTFPASIDVRNEEEMKAYAEKFIKQTGGIDLVIANAGVGGLDDLSSGDASYHGNIFIINVIGLLNTLLPFVPQMIAQQQGHLVAIASVAGFRVLPGGVTYAASKMAVRALMEGYGWELSRHGIIVTSINPGFVVSEMTQGQRFPMPFLLQTDEAVRRIACAIKRKRRGYTFPWPMALMAHLLPHVPGMILKRLRKTI